MWPYNCLQFSKGCTKFSYESPINYAWNSVDRYICDSGKDDEMRNIQEVCISSVCTRLEVVRVVSILLTLLHEGKEVGGNAHAKKGFRVYLLDPIRFLCFLKSLKPLIKMFSIYWSQPCMHTASVQRQ